MAFDDGVVRRMDPSHHGRYEDSVFHAMRLESHAWGFLGSGRWLHRPNS